jgi:hypothetical protein
MNKEKPIIFSTPMVQTIQNTKPGTWPAEPIDPSKPYKCMTRRVLVPQPDMEQGVIHDHTRFPMSLDSDMSGFWGVLPNGEDHRWGKIPDVGTLLWVRETFTKTKDGAYIYRADPIFDGCTKGDFAWDWTSPIFMPREASRINLEVKRVRIERVQDITPENVLDEGIYLEPPSGADPKRPENWDKMTERQKSLYLEKIARPTYMAQLHYANELISAYSKPWNNINAKRGYPWKDNPWVYVIEFMRVK